MSVEEVLARLQACSNAKMLAHNLKYGAHNNQFGVKMGDIRALANKLKTNHQLALQLWQTGNIDARLLATLIMDVKQLGGQELGNMLASETFAPVADWLYAYVIKLHADKEALRLAWMKSENKMCARIAWSLTSGNVVRNPHLLQLPALLDTIELEMPAAAPEIQWTMNTTLAQIGIHFPEHRQRAIAIGEKLGIFKNYPTSKGCTSPFAPIWINEMVKRQAEHK